VTSKIDAAGARDGAPGLVGLAPGVLALAAVGLAARALSGYLHVEYVLIAIALGMIVSNTVRLPAFLVAGINTYELWLKAGVVMMGSTLLMQNVLVIGGAGLGLVLVEIVLAVAVAAWLSRAFGLSERLGSLIGVGVGICGVSAIIGATGAIDAREEDSTYAIATILIFGAVMVFLFPIIGRALGMSDQAFGLWAGLAVDNTAETIATGMAYSEPAGQVTTVTKLTRNALMGPVILLFALAYARLGMSAGVTNKAAFLWERFPKFVLGFLLFSLLASVHCFSGEEVAALKAMSKWAFTLAFAGVGFRTQFRRMKAGLRPFLVGLGVETVVAVVTFALVYVCIPYVL